MLAILLSLGLALLGYLLGSLPFSVWVTRAFIGTDVREAGSGHATATNTIRQAGWLAGVIVFVLDISKGFLATWLAINFSELVWVVPLTAMMTVVGHNWPLWAGFRGGMGLATTGGSVLAVFPLGFFAGVGLLVAMLFLVRHGARAAVLSALLFTPLFWLLGAGSLVIWQAVLISLVVAVRFFSDWNRQYRELWLDREKKEASTE